MPLLNFLASHGQPGDRKVVEQFRPLADRVPGVPALVPSYRTASQALVDKLDTLDGSRRSAAIRGLHDAVMPKVRTAAKTGKPEHVHAALTALRDHGLRAAREHGVSIPKAHATAFNQLGGTPAPAAPLSAGGPQEA